MRDGELAVGEEMVAMTAKDCASIEANMARLLISLTQMETKRDEESACADRFAFEKFFSSLIMLN